MMKISEQLLKHIATLSAAHQAAIRKTVAAAFPAANPDPMHALVLAYQLGTLLHAIDKGGGDSPRDTINAILANAGNYRLINTEPAKTDDNILNKTSTGLTEDKLKHSRAKAVQARRAEIKYIARLATMPPDDVATEVYSKFAQCLDEELASAIGYLLRLSAEAAEPVAEAIIRLRTQRAERRVMSTQVMAYVAFSGYSDYPIDVDGAAVALQEAGYTVHRLPDKYRKYSQLPLDDHMEVVIAGRDMDDVFDEVQDIVDNFGGDCIECGPIATNYQPFVDLFSDTPGFVP
jgi:hypothetical protein